MKNKKVKSTKKQKRNINNKKREQRRKKQFQHNQEKISVENSISYSYGCEVVNENILPKFVNSFVSTSGLNRVIKVPQRKRGLTSSGKERHCHPNVQLLVDTYGGKRMVGYEVIVNRLCHIRLTDLRFHSVWLTPENKLVDVTKKDEQDYSFCNETQYFIPVSTDDILLKDVQQDTTNGKNLYEIGLFPEPMRETTKKPSLEDLLVTEKSMEDMGGKDWRMGGSFSQPSISTGKYLTPYSHLVLI